VGNEDDWPSAGDGTPPSRTEEEGLLEEDPVEEDKLALEVKKIQPKKTTFSNRRNYRTFGTAMTHVALCVQNRGFKGSLEVRKLYRVLPDPEAADHGLVRIIDESGEDYLYPERFFTSVSIPQTARRLFPRPFRTPSRRARSA